MNPQPGSLRPENARKLSTDATGMGAFELRITSRGHQHALRPLDQLAVLEGLLGAGSGVAPGGIIYQL